jgi:hypothetical protein
MTMDADRGGSGRGAPFTFGAENDPGLAADVFEYGTEIHPTGPGRYAGVTDLSSMYGGRILTPPHLDAIKARTAPFTAVVDGPGRLVSLELPLPGAGAFKATTYRVTYDQYGTAVQREPPDAEAVTPAPDSVHHLFDDAQFAGPMIG